jgi:hypothetical protein
MLLIHAKKIPRNFPSQANMYWVDTATLNAELRNTCHFDRISSVIFPQNYSGVRRMNYYYMSTTLEWI